MTKLQQVYREIRPFMSKEEAKYGARALVRIYEEKLTDDERAKAGDVVMIARKHG